MPQEPTRPDTAMGAAFPQHSMTLRQRSAWSAFCFDLLDEQGQRCGTMQWPWLGQAKNARLRWHRPGSVAGDIQMDWKGQPYRIRWEYLSRAMSNDIRWTLENGEGVTVATLHSMQAHGYRLQRPRLEWLSPCHAALVRQRRWWGVRYTLHTAQKGEHPEGGAAAFFGEIAEPRWLSLRRELVVRMQAPVDPAIQAFLGFVVLNAL